MKLSDACEAFLRDMKARGRKSETLRGYGILLRMLRHYATDRGAEDIEQVESGLLRDWRESWNLAPGTSWTRIAQAKSFFKFAVDADWIERSPAAKLQPPRDDAAPTMPLSRSEVRALLVATEGKARERALLLLRYSGLAIGDAATLATSALAGDRLTLRRAKSGNLVLCCLPEPVTDALARIARPGRAHYFWSGESSPRTSTNFWRARLNRLAKRAGVEGFKPHRLRDTFAVELRAAAVSMEDVSVLLGHSSIRTTERYYAPWDLSRRNRLLTVVRDVNARDPLVSWLAASGQNERAEAVPAAPANGSAIPSKRPEHIGES